MLPSRNVYGAASILLAEIKACTEVKQKLAKRTGRVVVG